MSDNILERAYGKINNLRVGELLRRQDGKPFATLEGAGFRSGDWFPIATVSEGGAFSTSSVDGEVDPGSEGQGLIHTSDIPSDKTLGVRLIVESGNTMDDNAIYSGSSDIPKTSEVTIPSGNTYTTSATEFMEVQKRGVVSCRYMVRSETGGTVSCYKRAWQFAVKL